MTHRRNWRFLLVGAVLLVVYGTVLPLLAPHPVRAHRMRFDSVNNGRLDIYNASVNDLGYPQIINRAATEWDVAADAVTVAVTANSNIADVKTYESCIRSTFDLGAYYPDTDAIIYNMCLLEHQGGTFNGRWLGKTPASRQARTVFHEIGHALGLKHTDRNPELSHEQSIMSILYRTGCTPKKCFLSSDIKTHFLPRKHDRDDIQERW